MSSSYLSLLSFYGFLHLGYFRFSKFNPVKETGFRLGVKVGFNSWSHKHRVWEEDYLESHPNLNFILNLQHVPTFFNLISVAIGHTHSPRGHFEPHSPISSLEQCLHFSWPSFLDHRDIVYWEGSSKTSHLNRRATEAVSKVVVWPAQLKFWGILAPNFIYQLFSTVLSPEYSK